MFAASKSGRASGGGPGPGPTDASFAYVPLLLNTGSTNGQQNNTFLDSSTNNFTITRNGTPTQGSRTPYWPNGQWSNQLPTTSDYLSIAANAVFTLGTANHTIEFWAYQTAFTNYSTPWNYASGATVQGTGNYYISNGGLSSNLLLGSGGAWGVNIAFTQQTLNVWHHYAITRNGSSFALFIDGVRVGTATYAGSITSQAGAMLIGRSTGTNDTFQGYISNLRVVNGTAVYDPAQTTITVPTAPLTAITNTVLLTCQSNRFRDNSSNAFTVATSGTPTVQAFQPFSPAASYSAATYAGSGYFNGSTDYLSSTITAVSPSIAVFECWLYNLNLDSTGTGNHYIQVDGAQTNYLISNNTTGGVRFLCRNDSGTNIFDLISATGVLKINQWQYVVGIRNATTASLYVDGARVATSSASVSTSTGTTLRIGSNLGTGRFLNGYISNVRIQSGTLPSGYDPASTTISIPTTPLTNVAGTRVLLNMANAGIYDAAAQNDITTVGNAQVSTAQSKWSPSSMAFDGTGDYLSVSAGSPQSLTFGTGNFTIEFWVYFTSNTGFQTLYDGRAAAGAYPLLYLNNGVINYYVGASAVITSVQPSTGVWIFMSLRRSSGTTQFFINGTQSGGSYADSNNYLAPPTSGARVGANFTGSDFLFGYIQDFRVTKAARAATPIPTAAFPTR